MPSSPRFPPLNPQQNGASPPRAPAPAPVATATAGSSAATATAMEISTATATAGSSSAPSPCPAPPPPNRVWIRFGSGSGSGSGLERRQRRQKRRRRRAHLVATRRPRPISAHLRPRDFLALSTASRPLHAALSAADKPWLAQCRRLLPQHINGRLAMVGFVAALSVEAARNGRLLSQAGSGAGLGWFVTTAALLSMASLVPLLQGRSIESRFDSVWSADAKLWNERFAMLGLVALAVTEFITGTPFVAVRRQRRCGWWPKKLGDRGGAALDL